MISARFRTLLAVIAIACAVSAACSSTSAPGTDLTDAEVENLVRRSFQYVAMYNVNNKFAASQGGWNTVRADTALKDHTMRDIARPNNDTLYISALLDLRAEPIVLDIPAFDSKYVSLMITAYDHYVNVPMSTRLGDFGKPEKMLIYSARSGGYDGQPVEGVDRQFEASGDFVSAVFRVMPHASDAARFARIVEEMQRVQVTPLSVLRGTGPTAADLLVFPQVGTRDADVFEKNLLEVMQFVFDHTTFDPADELDRALLAAYEPLGVAPGRVFDAGAVQPIDGARFRAVAERIVTEEMARATDPEFKKASTFGMFQPKGQMTLDLLVFQSVIGPIGLPVAEAAYPAVATTDGAPMNAMNDYVIRLAADAMPPAGAFWSFTLYDTANGFFIPNDRKKYSVGENAGMKLDPDGGIEVYIAAEQPQDVPLENWLPIVRRDENIDVILRIYVPDLERLKTWPEPKAELVSRTP